MADSDPEKTVSGVRVASTEPGAPPTIRGDAVATSPPSMPPAMPGDAIPGTMQMRPGQVVGHAPAMPTLTDGPLPDVAPPAVPPSRYELGPEIARGGMGRVVEATDTLLGRTVALKEALALDADSLRRFTRETKITARLEHPSIVPVHDAGTTTGGTPYYVMRKISGRPLERLVATAETLEERLALIPHVVAAAHAVAHAHERGVIHRDIKPSNILVGELGETIVIDWGLAKIVGEPADPHDVTAPAAVDASDTIRTRAGIVYGTPGFMAPEQLRGIVVNERCDVYALGATLYHLLSRKPPHHAKTADEMMKAAATRPPPSITELVPGVPPELSTIIDKSLAHDPRQRYQNARELAEDLQRFLTGQLVASHRYTRRERIVRFVRKNRVPVAITALATLALLVGGTIAVTKIIRERDRADTEARRARQEQLAAEDRTEKLLLQQARGKALTNPTEAIAMIKPLAAKQWREVRSIAAAARATGVAWSLPGPQHVETIELSRDGTRALVAGGDGSVQIYDLARRTSHVLSQRGPKRSARFADAERKIVTWSGTQLEVLDAGSAAVVSTVTVPSAIHDLEIVGVTAYWVDDAKRLWQLDLAGKTPLEIALDERIEQLAPSPDGRWIALSGELHLLMLDRTAPATPPLEVAFGRTQDLDWSDDGKHMVALVYPASDDPAAKREMQAFDVAATSPPQIIHKADAGNRELITFSNGRMYTIGPTGVAVASREQTGARRALVGGTVGLREGLDGAVIAASQGGIAVLTDEGDHTLYVPEGRVDIVEASPRSPYVVALTEGRLVAWDLTEILPRRLAGTPTMERFVGNDSVFAAFDGNTAEWFELASRKSHRFEGWPSTLIDIVGSPTGSAVITIDLARRGRLIVRDGDPEDLDGEIAMAIFASPDQVVLGTPDGALQLLDVKTRQRTTLGSQRSELVHLTTSRTSPPWIAAVYRDGTLWRKNLAQGNAETTKLAAIPPQLLVEPDGSVVFPEGAKLRQWHPTGSLEQLLEMPRPIVALGPGGPGFAIAFTAGFTYVVDLSSPNRWRDSETDVVEFGRAVISPLTGMMVLANRGSIDVFDPNVKHRFTLASSPGLTYASPQISNDGRYVIARRVVTDRAQRDLEDRTFMSLLAWRIVHPETPDDVVQWLDQMTNATVDRQTGSLVWR
ncbi:MAG TPA: serine/threonine-protein kinase [Kofleriaceae bacterium]|nr:serine/threonine-protein kinase [Kofleriaceae bacterium]